MKVRVMRVFLTRAQYAEINKDWKDLLQDYMAWIMHMQAEALQQNKNKLQIYVGNIQMPMHESTAFNGRFDWPFRTCTV